MRENFFRKGVSPNEIMYMGSYHQWLLKPAGEQLINLSIMKTELPCVFSRVPQEEHTPPSIKRSYKKNHSLISSSLI